jgi:hypothetical protein
MIFHLFNHILPIEKATHIKQKATSMPLIALLSNEKVAVLSFSMYDSMS